MLKQNCGSNAGHDQGGLAVAPKTT
ncbi:uncharacterized protein METZ01_LOCUS248829, partial [marine metagenome]